MTLDELPGADDPAEQALIVGAKADKLRYRICVAHARLAAGTMPWVANRLNRRIEKDGFRLRGMMRRIARLNNEAAAERVAIEAAAEELAGLHLDEKTLELLFGRKEAS